MLLGYWCSVLLVLCSITGSVVFGVMSLLVVLLYLLVSGLGLRLGLRPVVVRG